MGASDDPDPTRIPGPHWGGCDRFRRPIDGAVASLSIEASDWFGLGAPRTTPVEIVEDLNKTVGSVLGEAEFERRVAELGGTVIPGTPANFGKLVAAETEKWAKVIKFAGVKAE